MTPLQTKIAEIVQSYLQTPVDPELTLGEMGLRDDSWLVSISCELDEMIGRELDPGAVTHTCTIADLVALVEGELAHG